jgi:hypothetical protein
MKPAFRIGILLLCLGTLLSLTACGDTPAYGDRETFAVETFAAVENSVITFADGVDPSVYPVGEPTGNWIDGCSDADRDDQFDAYILRHESKADGNTTFTYLVYYPHGEAAYTVTPALLESDGGYVLEMTYAPQGTKAEPSLCYLSVTLPTDQAPRVRLLLGQDVLGVMSTVTADAIPRPSAE